MKCSVAVAAIILAVTACKPPPTLNQVRQQNQQLMGTPQGVKTLTPQLMMQCDQTISHYYLTQNVKPHTWQKVIAQTAMDTTNLYIRNAAQTISRRTGFDVSRSVAFMTRYRGENVTGFAQAEDFICVYEVYAGNQMGLKAVYNRQQFENLWGIHAMTPAQWDGPSRGFLF